MRPRELLSDVLLLGGAGGVTYGLELVWPGAAWIAGGAFALLFGVLLAIGGD
jgi:hypothetical protein